MGGGFLTRWLAVGSVEEFMIDVRHLLTAETNTYMMKLVFKKTMAGRSPGLGEQRYDLENVKR